MNMKEYFKKYTKQSKKGFTLVELIAVIVILSVISTATISVFVAIQSTVRDTGDITTQQFSSTQLERFIRNEFQTASKIDVHDYAAPSGSTQKLPQNFSAKKNDEYVCYDPDAKQLKFVRYIDEPSAGGVVPSNILVIDNVEDVVFDICPLDTTAASTKGMSYKLIYKVKTDSYTYNGGIVLGNSHDGDADTFESAKTLFTKTGADGKEVSANAATIHWCTDTDENDDYCITFHSLNSQKNVGTTSTASTP